MAGQKLAAPRDVAGASTPSVLAFVGRGQRLVWGVTANDVGTLRFYNLQLTPEQQAELGSASYPK